MLKPTLCAIGVAIFILNHSGNAATIETLVLNTFNKFTVKEGDPLELNCNVKRWVFDGPHLQNMWQREDALPLPNGALVYYVETLQFPAVTRDHFGVYVCTVDGGSPSWGKSRTMVEVQFKPEITRAYHLSDSDTNDEIVFACEAQSYPSPQVTWMKNGKEAGFPVNTWQFGHARTFSTLRVQKTAENLKSSYSCQFKNDIGAMEKTIENIPYEFPMILKNTLNAFIADEGQKIELECNVAGHPKSRITWHKKNGGNLPTGDTIYYGNVLKFASLSHEDNGDYMCTVDNGLGSGYRTYNLDVKFKPIIMTHKLKVTDNHIKYGCYQKSNPSEIISLSRNGQKYDEVHPSIFNYNATDNYYIYSVPKTEENLNATFTCNSKKIFYVVEPVYDRR